MLQVNVMFHRTFFPGDILWFIDQEIRASSQECIRFILTYITAMFCIVEIACQLVLFLTEGHQTKHMLSYGPMFFTSVHMLANITPLLIQRTTYCSIYKEYLETFNLKMAEKSALVEMLQLFQTCLYSIILILCLSMLGPVGFIPVNGLDYDTNIFPAIKALRLLDGYPKALIIGLIIMNYTTVFIKAYCLMLYGLHIIHMCVLYAVANMLLRGKINSIKHRRASLATSLLADDKEYQQWVGYKLRECIQLDINIRRFADTQINYFKWVMLCHVCNAVVLLSLLAYIITFMGGGDSPMGSLFYTASANFVAFMYGFYGELYLAQVGLNRNSLEKSPWHTFDSSNRKSIIIFMSNLEKPKYITAGGIFILGYQLIISIFHKVFNGLTVLSNMAAGE